MKKSTTAKSRFTLVAISCPAHQSVISKNKFVIKAAQTSLTITSSAIRTAKTNNKKSLEK
jgi:hypothetical protein